MIQTMSHVSFQSRVEKTPGKSPAAAAPVAAAMAAPKCLKGPSFKGIRPRAERLSNSERPGKRYVRYVVLVVCMYIMPRVGLVMEFLARGHKISSIFCM